MKKDDPKIKETSTKSNPNNSTNALSSYLPKDVLEEIDINYSSKTDCGAFVKYITAAGNTTVEYTFEIGSSVGNDQFITPSGSNYSLINEAAIFVNNRIFCMKCFPSKLKDDSTTLKIIWKIIF